MDINRKLEDYILNSDLNDAETQENLVHIAREQLFAFHKLMAYYRCAIMEIETKFNVINEEFSVLYERNPIENISSMWRGCVWSVPLLMTCTVSPMP